MSINRISEWGVFEAVRGGGVASLPSDELPPFVHIEPVEMPTSPGREIIVAKKPVLYVYGDPETRVRLCVEAAGGESLYHWPQADTSTSGQLAWDLTLDETAGELEDHFPPGTTWFRDMRESDATWLGHGDESERFVFYEFAFDKLRFASDDDEPRWLADHPLCDAVLLQGGGSAMRWGVLGDIAAGQRIAPAELEAGGSGLAALEARLRSGLLARGLNADEARHLLDAWKPWLRDNTGRRYIGFLERAHYDRLLPMKVEPAPLELARVGLVVGHLE